MNVAIVGHGVSLVGQGLGKEIDAHDTVIRFTRDKHHPVKDFGEKITILAFGSFHLEKAMADPRHFEEAWHYGMLPGRKRYNLFREKIHTVRLRVVKASEDLRIYRDVYGAKRPDDSRLKNKQAKLSRGAAITLEAMNVFDGEITLYGFDNMAHESAVYLSVEGPPHTSPLDHHDSQLERRMIEDRAKEKGVKVKWM